MPRKPSERNFRIDRNKKDGSLDKASSKANALRHALRIAESAIEMAKDSGHKGASLANALVGMGTRAQNLHVKRFFDRERFKILKALSEKRVKEKSTGKSVSGKEFSGNPHIELLVSSEKFQDAVDILHYGKEFGQLYDLVRRNRVRMSLDPKKSASMLADCGKYFVGQWRDFRTTNYAYARDCHSKAIILFTWSVQMFSEINTNLAHFKIENLRKQIYSLKTEFNREEDAKFDMRVSDKEWQKNMKETLSEEDQLLGVEEEISDSVPGKSHSERLSLSAVGESLINQGNIEEGIANLFTAKDHNKLYEYLTMYVDVYSSFTPSRLAGLYVKLADLLNKASEKGNEKNMDKQHRTNELLTIDCLQRAVEIFRKIPGNQSLIVVKGLLRKIGNLRGRP
ncbi:MAG: hypothetical protein Q7K42_04180 [Candidatus Diapherotrites archaeon]|nr:hypothetical protein [Candidatus Diapherotrites archaeon]